MAVRATPAAVLAVLLTATGCGRRVPPGFDPSRIADLSCRQIRPPADDAPTWVAPTDPTARYRLSRWCGTVGSVFFQPRPHAEAGGPIDRLAIVSWNIHEGGGDVDDLVRRLRLGEFTAGESIDQFVLLLQEATRRGDDVPTRVPHGLPSPRRIGSRSGSPDGDVRRFADEGFAVLYAPSMRNGGDQRDDNPSGSAEDRGNAIVSTLPLRNPRLIELPLERQRRVAAGASVEGRSRSGARWCLELVDVHFDTALALLHGGPFEARRRQASALLDALRESPRFSRGDTVTVVGGDLNTWNGRGETAVRALSDALPDAAPSDSAPTWTGPLGLHATLDHIFVRGSVSPVRVARLPGRFGSDHYPVLTVVRF